MKLEELCKETISQEAYKQELIDKELARRPLLPLAGSIFIFDYPDKLALQWVVLDSDKNDLYLTVPADDAPMVGSTDIELPDDALCSPLVLRCGQSLHLPAKQFNRESRVGILEEWHRLRALDKVKQISEKKFRIAVTKILPAKVSKIIMEDIMHSSVLHQEMDYEPYYMEWIKQVSKERRALQLHLLWEKLQTVLKKIKNRIESFLRKYYPIIGGVIATVLVVVISCPYLCRPVTGLDEIYKDVIASKKFSTLEIVLESEVTPNVLSFSESSHPGSDAMQAFRAGLLKGQQDLLSRSTPVEKDWSKWAHYFKLGRWTVLLESVCHSIPQYEVPKGFWDDQKQIFAQLSNDFSIKPDMIDETEVDWVRSRFDGYIGPLLKQPHKASLLAEELKLMREGLMP